MLAHLTDLHLRAGNAASEAKVERAVAAVAAFDPRPDAVVVTGDVADVPAPEVYRRARELLEGAGLPLLVVPGNHDDRDLVVDAFGPLPAVAGAGPLRVVGADTSVPGRDDGRLGAEQLEALDAELTAHADTPTVLAMHHPPVLTGIRTLDAIGLDAGDRAALADLLDHHPQVRVVACGHVHRTMATAFAGAAVLIAPGVSSQLRLDLRPGDGLPIEMTGEPSGFALHVLVDGSIRSHVATVPDG